MRDRMNRLEEYISESRVSLDLEVGTGADVLAELARLLGGNDETLREAVHDDLVAREHASSTGVVGGVAFPHARTDSLPGLRLAFVRTAAENALRLHERVRAGAELEKGQSGVY